MVILLPAISTFFGIIIYMYKETGNKHHLPHIHAKYAGQEAVFSLDGEIMEGDGNLPAKKVSLIRAWLIIHKEELEANWTII